MIFFIKSIKFTGLGPLTIAALYQPRPIFWFGLNFGTHRLNTKSTFVPTGYFGAYNLFEMPLATE